MNDAAHLTKLALLIDGDNVRATLMPEITEKASALGTIAVCRIYGQLTTDKMKPWLKHIADFNLTGVDVTPVRSSKNATDIRLVIEAMDMLHRGQLDGICIVSSDSDFAPLASRIRATAVAAYGFGEKKAPEAYQKAFDRFFQLGETQTTKTSARKPSAVSPPPPVIKSAPRQPPAARKARNPVLPKPALPLDSIFAAINSSKGPDGWSRLGAVGNIIGKAIDSFTAKKFGYKSMSLLIAAIDGIETRKENGVVFVRRK